MPKPPNACPWFPPPPLALLLPPFEGPLLLLVAPPDAAPLPPLLILVDVNGSGKGDGNSSTDRECGFRKEKGPMVKGRWWVLVFIPFDPVRLFEVKLNVLEPDMEIELLGFDPKCGVGGGEVPSLLRSFLVMGGLE